MCSTCEIKKKINRQCELTKKENNGVNLSLHDAVANKLCKTDKTYMNISFYTTKNIFIVIIFLKDI